MIETKTTPKWARLPLSGTTCRLCGRPVYAHEEHEVVKPKDARPTMFMHTACVMKEVPAND